MDNLSPYTYTKTKDPKLDAYEFFRKFSHSPSKSSSSTISPENFIRPRSKSVLTKRTQYIYPPEFNAKYSPGSTSPSKSRQLINCPIIKTSYRSRSMKEKRQSTHRRSIYVPLVESEQYFLGKNDKKCKDKTLVWSMHDHEKEDLDKEDIQLYRMRSFKRTSRGIICQADTIKAKSICSLEKFDSLGMDSWENLNDSHTTCSKFGITCLTDSKNWDKLEIQIIGSTFVGKTTMASQFMTSEHICSRMDSVNEDADKFVSVYIDDKEWSIWLHDTENKGHAETNEVTVEMLTGMSGYMVMYAIDDLTSFVYAKQVLGDLVEKAGQDSVVVLVGNKNDLERSREVSTESGKRLSKVHRCLFYEISTALNHKVDDLLIQTLLKIRQNLKAKEKRFLKLTNNYNSTRRVSSLRNSGKKIKNFFQRKFNVKSCEMIIK